MASTACSEVCLAVYLHAKSLSVSRALAAHVTRRRVELRGPAAKVSWVIFCSGRLLDCQEIQNGHKQHGIERTATSSLVPFQPFQSGRNKLSHVLIRPCGKPKGTERGCSWTFVPILAIKSKKSCLGPSNLGSWASPAKSARQTTFRACHDITASFGPLALTHLVGVAIEIIGCKSHKQSHKLGVARAILILGHRGGHKQAKNVP